MTRILPRIALACASGMLAVAGLSATDARSQPIERAPGAQSATEARSPAAKAAPALSRERRQELLFDAARIGRADVIPAIVAAGVNVNARDQRGFTPLILAAYNGHLAAVEALIAAKADPCLADAGQGNTAQMGAAFRGQDAIAVRLVKAGCDINMRNKAGQTALMMAALFGRTEQVKLLKAAGADATLRDAVGNTAASLAAVQGNSAVVTLLNAAPR